MRSQNSILTHTTHSLNALSLTTNQIKSKDQQLQHHYTAEPIQMTTGGSISGNNTNSVATQQKSSTSTLSSCNTIASTSSINTLSKASTISSTARHSNGNLSTHSNNINNNSTTAVNNNNNKTKNNNNNNNSHNNNNNNEGDINPNPNWNKLQTLEQRKLELEKLLNEKNWLLQQIHKQEAQILNGNYENFNLFETGKVGATIVNAGNTTAANTTNSILRRKGSSSLKLSKSNVHFNGKNNRLTLSKSEYDLAQENKLNHQPTTTNQSVMSIKKRQGAPQKTNSFHDSTSASALSLTKSPSFEYNGSTAAQSPIGGNGTHIIKYSVVRPPHQGSTENLSNNIGVTQCDKYYLSPTSQMYSDGSGFIKASQNIKQCLSPSPLHKIIALNDTDSHRAKQQPLHSTNGHKLVHHNGSQPHLEQYESVDALSLSPSTNCAFDQGQHIASQHSNLWRTISNSDRSGWCDSTSYVELDSDGGNPYHNIKPLAKKVLPGSSMQQSPESPSLGNFYPVGGMGGVGNYPNNAVDKASDEISISSVNSETSKKPKNKQWMESSLDGPIIRPNILQSTPSVVDAIALCPALSPTLSQNPQYTYYVAGRQATTSSAAAASGKLTPSPAPAAGGGSLLMPVATSRPPTRTLTHHSHPHHKQSYRERTKLSSQSMSSGSYRAPKTKLDDDNNHLSHSTSFLNVDPYHQHNFHMQPSPQQQQQPYHHNHYHTELTNNGNFTMPHLLLQQQQHAPQMHHQKPLKPTPSSTSQQPTVAKFSPTIQQQCTNGDDFVGTIRYATSVATQPSRLCNPSQAITKNTMQKAIPPNSLSINPGPQLSPQTSTIAATSPDIRIESPKNMTVVQQATFLPYKEVTKPFEMSDFYKYSTKFRQKDANTATISKNTS